MHVKVRLNARNLIGKIAKKSAVTRYKFELFTNNARAEKILIFISIQTVTMLFLFHSTLRIMCLFECILRRLCLGVCEA
jgi:hypothetical protein